MDKDLELFNELVKDEVPDCDVNVTLFGFHCGRFNVVIVKSSETTVGAKTTCMYRLSINGALNCTRFIHGKENTLVKAYMIINEYFGAKSQEEMIEEYNNEKEIFTGSRYSSAEF